ncbi:MAG: proline dehydrogenase [Novosphingobium sp.]
MKHTPRSLLRGVRYALPGQLGKVMPAPTPEAVAHLCRRLARRGIATTVGYFQAEGSPPAAIAAANLSAAAALSGTGAYLSVKAPPLEFAAGLLDRIAAAGLPILFDAHAPRDAQATHDALARLLPAHPGSGLAIPARWRRSPADAERFRDAPVRIRLVKGEWPDPAWPDADAETAYLALAERLAGRSAPVAVATHDPQLARRALAALLAAGTPCELEQLRGLPRRRTMAAAQELGVPVRVYLPFGPGWWPYALNQALARPYLPAWFIRDLAPA